MPNPEFVAAAQLLNPPSPVKVPTALDDLRGLTNSQVFDPVEASLKYGIDTGGAERILTGAVVLGCAEDLQAVVLWANKHKQALWPISGGRNFGYGTALPVHHLSLIIDMTQLKGIRHIPAAQSVVVEPGVNQGDLEAFLAKNNLEYLVPTTGAGPNGSLIGNAMDGGYGLTPVSDHFDGLSRLVGVWGNGDAFDHSFAQMGSEDMAARWCTGTGVDYRSLLRQGNVGIVSSATLQLARKPEAACIIIVQWTHEHQFLASQDELSLLMEEIPQLTGLLSMSATRALSALPGGPLAHAPEGPGRQEYLAKAVADRKMAAWTGLGTIYGSRASISGACRDISRRLKKHGGRVLCFTPFMIKALLKIQALVPASLSSKIESLGHALTLLDGQPITDFLQLAYALDKSQPKPSRASNPARDGQGLLWYAPLVPLTEEGIRRYLEEIQPILLRHGFDPLMAATTRTSRVCTGTIPLLFHKTPENIARARACYAELVSTGIKLGMPPYRLGSDAMGPLVESMGEDTLNFARKMKEALDPNDVIAPGRYAPAIS